MNRWSDFRMFDSSIPETEYEAAVFLDNAFWHIYPTCDPSALSIINKAKSMILLNTTDSSEEAPCSAVA